MFPKKHDSNLTEHDVKVQEEKLIKELRSEMGELEGRALKFCTDECLRRYLKAWNWEVEKSKKMLEETLEWRSSFKPEEICWPEVAEEGATGKLYRANFHDLEGRTIWLWRPAKQTSHENQMRHVVYLLENAILNLEEKQEEMVWLVDFARWTLNSVPVKTARETARILQRHYPEWVAVVFLCNPPRIFEAFWKVIKYFVEPKNFEKVRFVYPKSKEAAKETMRKHFDLEVLPVACGGRSQEAYDHREFSEMMLADDVKKAKFWGLDL